MHRIQQRGTPTTASDTFETQGKDFQQRVHDGYRILARNHRIPTIQCIRDDGVLKSPYQMQQEVLSIINLK